MEALRIRRVVLVELMQQSLGEEKAAHLVVSTAAKLGLGTFDFSEEEACQLLVELQKEQGLVGITAMLAKTRLPRLMREKGESRKRVG